MTTTVQLKDKSGNDLNPKVSLKSYSNSGNQSVLLASGTDGEIQKAERTFIRSSDEALVHNTHALFMTAETQGSLTSGGNIDAEGSITAKKGATLAGTTTITRDYRISGANVSMDSSDKLHVDSDGGIELAGDVNITGQFTVNGSAIEGAKIEEATQTTAGLMSAADKTKLDGLSSSSGGGSDVSVRQNSATSGALSSTHCVLVANSAGSATEEGPVWKLPNVTYNGSSDTFGIGTNVELGNDSGTMTIKGSVQSSAPITVGGSAGDAHVLIDTTGDLEVSDGTTSIFIASAAMGDVTIGSESTAVPLTVNGKATINGAAKVNGTLGVDGKTTLYNTLAFQADDRLTIKADTGTNINTIASQNPLVIESENTAMVAGKTQTQVGSPSSPLYLYGSEVKINGNDYTSGSGSSVTIGETEGTAYDGAKGAATTKKVNSILQTMTDLKGVETSPTTCEVNFGYMEDNGSEFVYNENQDISAVIPAATTTTAGVMSAEDKVKLDGLGTAVTLDGLTVSNADSVTTLNSGENNMLVKSEEGRVTLNGHGVQVTSNDGGIEVTAGSGNVIINSTSGSVSIGDETGTTPIHIENKNASVTVSDGVAVTGTLTVNGKEVTGEVPTASSTTLGGIKVGSGLSIDSDGVLSATKTSAFVTNSILSTSYNVTEEGLYLASTTPASGIAAIALVAVTSNTTAIPVTDSPTYTLTALFSQEGSNLTTGAQITITLTSGEAGTACIKSSLAGLAVIKL